MLKLNEDNLNQTTSPQGQAQEFGPWFMAFPLSFLYRLMMILGYWLDHYTFTKTLKLKRWGGVVVAQSCSFDFCDFGLGWA